MELNVDLYGEIWYAHNDPNKIYKYTPMEYSTALSNMYKVNIYLKHEYQQHTGSFKLRGASNKIKQILKQKQNSNKINIVTASTGNHGCAVSYACKELNKTNNDKLNCIVFVPKSVDPSKAEIIESYNAVLNKIDSTNCLDAEKEAMEYVRNNPEDSIYVSPYNDIDVIIGQGSIGKEIFEDMEPVSKMIDAIFVSIGGGGLIGGIGAYVKTAYPDCKIIGCQPENSKVMYESLKAGVILQDVEEYETLSDGTAGGIDAGSVTFPLLRDYVDDIILANEKEIADAFTVLLDKEKIVVEGSAALTLACLIKTKEEWVGKNVVLVLCGKNISLDKIKKILLN